ncbi:hypothetical protein [Dyella mobilis]|uniref:Uncharacterized protein n=1 Tax=Dyella mobilis TaxID=1849582 RepID=A0ABS2KFN3_9GAMM|nr:hypothetical protein [Dyella mobilis]MBM7129899.1 hypothetical protein [Dyella mobilis]GLQ97838.1 hypothetical protein GCM10007863_22580 [Dyella mobilis]
MIHLEVSPKEMAYLLLSLKRYQESLLAQEAEDLGDAATDLIVIQSLAQKLRTAIEAK